MRPALSKRRSAPLQVAVVDGRLPATSPVEQQFAEFYERACPPAVAHAARFLPRDRAWDAVQDAALELFQKWSDLPPDRRTLRYFLGSVHFRVLDEMRRTARREATHVALDEDLEAELPAPEPGLLAELVEEHHDEYEVIERMVAAFPARVREAWLLCREQGLTRDEIAEVMNVSPVTVRRHLMRATELIRRELMRRRVRGVAPTTAKRPGIREGGRP